MANYRCISIHRIIYGPDSRVRQNIHTPLKGQPKDLHYSKRMTPYLALHPLLTWRLLPPVYVYTRKE